MKKYIQSFVLIMLLSFSLQAQEPGEPPSSTEPQPEAVPNPAPNEEPTTTAESSGATMPSQIQGVDFKFQTDQSRLEISISGEITFEKNISEADKQVIIDIKNAKISSKYSRKLDTSSFKSNVSLISPYQNGNDVRVVIQLKETGDVQVSNESGRIVALIDNKTGGTTALAQGSDSSSAGTTDQSDANSGMTQTDQSNTSTPEVTSGSDSSTSMHSSNATADGNIEEFTKASDSKQYVGKKITLQLRDVLIKDVFRTISEASDFNIVIGDEVTGKITMNLVDVPWDQALDIILKSNKLAAERNGNVLRVTTLDNLTKEKSAELAANVVKEAAEPLIVKIFPISYANIDNMKTILEDFLSSPITTAGGGTSPAATNPANPTNANVSILNNLTGSSGSAQAAQAASAAASYAPPQDKGARKGSIQIDKRTRSLVMKDTPTNMEKAKRIIKELDIPTPQILIEAKFVSVTEQKGKAVKGRIFSTSRQQDGQGGYRFNNRDVNWGAMFGGVSSDLTTPFAISAFSDSTGGASFGLAPSAGLIPGVSDELAAFLQLLESEGHSKTISNPRVITQNNESAEISQGRVIYITTAGGVGTSGNVAQVNATLKLNVTPQVTNDGAVNLKISFTEDSLGDSVGSNVSTNSKKVDTNVLVDSGNTLVLGGIYQNENSTTKTGIPILRDLPIIGIFFGSSTNAMSKSELFIFITPRIVNEKESGISG